MSRTTTDFREVARRRLDALELVEAERARRSDAARAEQQRMQHPLDRNLRQPSEPTAGADAASRPRSTGSTRPDCQRKRQDDRQNAREQR